MIETNKLLYDLLYVEDENEVRRDYAQYLERFFTHVYEASNAKDALKIYKDKKPSILIIDINLGGMSGIELLQEIRKNDHTTKAIMLTANSDVNTLLSASELKLTKYLIKPVSRSELKEALSLAIKEIQNFTTLANKIIVLKDSFYWDTQNSKLFQHDKEKILTKQEIKLLSYLLSDIKRTFSVDDIVFELWYDSEKPKDNALKTLIKGLRKKLPQGTIKNVFGVGYKIET